MIQPNSELIIDYELVRNNIQLIREKSHLPQSLWQLLKVMPMGMILIPLSEL